MEKDKHAAAVEYDPNCYLCPGNPRAGGARNPNYTSTFVFTNDFAALLPDTPEEAGSESDLLVWDNERGTCKVVCFSPRHDLTVARMDVAAIRMVIDVWAEEYLEIGALPYVNHVQIFENRGEMMGASNPHPHCQIWATEHLPNEIVKDRPRRRSGFSGMTRVCCASTSRRSKQAASASFARTMASSRWCRSGLSGRLRRCW